MAKRKPKLQVQAMDFRRILIVALQVAVQFVPPPFNLFLSLLLEHLLPLLNTAAFGAPAVFAAPDELKTWLMDFLNGAIDQITRPIIRLVLKRLVSSLGPVAIDAIWDKLVELGILSGPAASTFPHVMQAAPDTAELVSEAELAAVAEAELMAAA